MTTAPAPKPDSPDPIANGAASALTDCDAGGSLTTVCFCPGPTAPVALDSGTATTLGLAAGAIGIDPGRAASRFDSVADGESTSTCAPGFGLVRKPGKLPHKKVSKTYDLEYGKDTLEMHADAIVKGQRVLIVDDVLATGGTMRACCELVADLGGNIVGVAVLTELLPLGGRAKVAPHKVHSVLKYE